MTTRRANAAKPEAIRQLSPKISVAVITGRIMGWHRWCQHFEIDTGFPPAANERQWKAWGLELFGREAIAGLPYEEVAQLIYGKLSRENDHRRLVADRKVLNDQALELGQSLSAPTDNVAIVKRAIKLRESGETSPKVAKTINSEFNRTFTDSTIKQQTWTYARKMGLTIPGRPAGRPSTTEKKSNQ